jgi:hypothetical protein
MSMVIQVVQNQSEIESVIARAEDVLQAAYAGLDMMRSEKGSQKNLGLRNVLTFARSVTFVLQNLSSKSEDFDNFYTPHQEKMKADPVFSFFPDARNNLEKQGKLQIEVKAEITLSSADMQAINVGKPPGAKSFFIGDELGGSGWLVDLPNGEELKYYTVVPTSVASVETHFNGVLIEKFLPDDGRSAVELSEHILEQLSIIVDDARLVYLEQPPAERYNGKPLPSYLRIVK